MSINLKNAKIIFMGTPNFSAPILSGLIDNYKVITIVTQPDKKAGRQQILSQSPIKQIAKANNIEVFQPEKLKDNQAFFNKIKELNPELIVVAAYGFILPKQILAIPRYGVINVHASLLPKYRGASPIQAAILNGEKETGVTIMLVNEKMDQGDILSQAKANLDQDETFLSLHDKLSVLGAHLLINTLPQYLNGEIQPKKQDDAKATYCPIITKADGKIDWLKSADEIERQVRAFYPWPGTWTFWNNKKLKIHKVSKLNTEKDKAGKVFEFDNGLAVSCGQNSLKIEELQLEGKKIMTAKEFLNGYKNIIGSILQ
ncbi:MAG: methionyl-tRNA formyltransferase [Candidatus Buchananbacteria bacterium]|nr:methionyl-tRNA formyltransferase [Candidatus Buchananbacteria bacterium]